MGIGYRFTKWMLGLTACFMLGLVSCQLAAQPLGQAPTRVPTDLQVQTPTVEVTNSPEVTFVPTVSSTAKPVFYEPAGCWQPPDDYTHVRIIDYTLNSRTYAMLQQAARLYDGKIDVTGSAIIQGSYSNKGLNDHDAHLGGGAVDISVTLPNSNSVLYTEIEPLIQALRTVGFAAWLREDDVMQSGSGIHIHAIAIGDKDLSPTAKEQLNGTAGYLRGYDGLPVTSGDPTLDRYGGPLICRWMLESGYADLRMPTVIPTPGLAWQERLRQAALAYQAPFPEDAELIAQNLNFLGGQYESAENICGPLSAAILRDAGLLPTQPGPVQNLKSYWQNRPSENGRPWNMFSERDYEVFHFDTPLAEFDFSTWPLQPADFLYTYAKDRGFEHMFIVTEVDTDGRAYTITNQYQIWGNKIWGTMLILRYLLYDPQTPGAGIIYNEWSDPRLGQTGNNGFDVMRKRGLEAGTLYAYTIRPGDTLPKLANRFGATLESLVQANPGLDLANLQVGQPVNIPIPPYHPG